MTRLVLGNLARFYSKSIKCGLTTSSHLLILISEAYVVIYRYEISNWWSDVIQGEYRRSQRPYAIRRCTKTNASAPSPSYSPSHSILAPDFPSRRRLMYQVLSLHERLIVVHLCGALACSRSILDQEEGPNQP